MSTYRIDIREGDGSGAGRPFGTPRPAPIQSVTFDARDNHTAVARLDAGMDAAFGEVYGELYEADSNTFLAWQRSFNPIDRRWGSVTGDPAAARDAMFASDWAVGRAGWFGYDDDWLDPWEFATPTGHTDKAVINVDAGPNQSR